MSRQFLLSTRPAHPDEGVLPKRKAAKVISPNQTGQALQNSPKPMIYIG